MLISKTESGFEYISQRYVYKLGLYLASFKPIKSDIATEEDQKALYDVLGKIITTLYDEPSILSLPDAKNIWKGGTGVNNPEYVKAFRKIRNEITLFYAFFMYSALKGTISENNLVVSADRLKEVVIKGPHLVKTKIKFKPAYFDLLKKVGFNCSHLNDLHSNDFIKISHDNAGLLKAIYLLSQKSEGNIFRFVFGLYDSDMSWWLRVAEKQLKLPAYFFDKHEKAYIENGFTKKYEMSGGDIAYYLVGNVSGLKIEYCGRGIDNFSIQLLNSIGFKAILEHSDELQDVIKDVLIKSAKPCNNCRNCIQQFKDKTNVKIHSAIVEYNGEKHALCPMFLQFRWNKWSDELNDNIMEIFLKLTFLQEKYGKPQKKKK